MRIKRGADYDDVDGAKDEYFDGYIGKCAPFADVYRPGETVLAFCKNNCPGKYICEPETNTLDLFQR